LAASISEGFAENARQVVDIRRKRKAGQAFMAMA
jgi:hypothetical protein